MPTTLDHFNKKRDSLKSLEALKKFLVEDMKGYAFSFTFPNGDSRMGVGNVIVFINAPSQYVSIRPVYQVGNDEADAVARTVKALPRLLSQVRDVEQVAEAEMLEGIVSAPRSVGSINRPNRAPVRNTPAPKAPISRPKREPNGGRKSARG